LLSSQLLNAHEEERASLSRDIHDDLGQLATAALLQLRMADRAHGELHTQKIEQATEAVTQLLERTHQLAAGLRPPTLQELGLKAAVESYLSEFKARSGVEVRAHLQLSGQEPPAVISRNLFRMLQEALTNVAKHAAAQEVSVRLEEQEQTLTLTVSDKGTGFHPERVESSGLGILGMRERAELLGGRIAVVSHPGGGTQIQVDLPLMVS
jgi:signal transduction histidine kinase